MPYGRVVRAITGPRGLKKGAEVTLQLSDGTSAAPPPSSNGSGQGAEAARTGTGGANSAPSGDQQQQQPAPEPLIRQEDIDAVANDIRSFFGL